ncbi:excalibur calcium-binding domain-containing protein [Lysobacter sp. HDW10]|nr:excalibur calcium-binding domain-containing protein [Lysobacter sp. HDW10]
MRRILLFGFLILATTPAFSHGGRLNKYGCHNDRRTGGYHCHRSAMAPSANARRSRDSAGARTTRAKRYRAEAKSFARDKYRSARQNTRTFVREIRYFANCSEARALGAAPVRRGEPGYARHLDRDNDGVGCE